MMSRKTSGAFGWRNTLSNRGNKEGSMFSTFQQGSSLIQVIDETLKAPWQKQ